MSQERMREGARRLSQLPLIGLRIERELCRLWAHMLPTTPKFVRNGYWCVHLTDEKPEEEKRPTRDMDCPRITHWLCLPSLPISHPRQMGTLCYNTSTRDQHQMVRHIYGKSHVTQPSHSESKDSSHTMRRHLSSRKLTTVSAPTRPQQFSPLTLYLTRKDWVS